jgi:copper chaperone
METTVLKVGGMTCGGCVNSVTRILKALPGVRAAEVSLERGEARISFDPALASVTQIRGAIEDAGYQAH